MLELKIDLSTGKELLDFIMEHLQVINDQPLVEHFMITLEMMLDEKEGVNR